jgi:hypothetical protein
MARKLAGLAVMALLVTGLSVAAVPAAHAYPLATSSWGAANLISYADSDFESGVGDWVNYSNATVTQDTSTAYLHRDSLKMVSGTSGSQAIKMGTGTSAPQVNVTAGDVYRESAWVKAPALSGRTVTFADGFYNSSGTWLGWTSGSTVTLNSAGNWQYVQDLITAPPGAAYMVGSPRITEGGVAAGEALNLDEVLVMPYRAAAVIGAEDGSGDCTAFSTANSAIGPLQTCKIFYGPSSALPGTYSGSTCAKLPANVTCLISYKVMTTNVASYVGSIPAGRNVILTYWQEPENDSFSYNGLTGGPAYVAEYESQVNLIRSATTSASRANVFVAMDAMDYQYDQGTSHNLGGAGGACSFIPPSSYVDFYLSDHYEFTASGSNMSADSGSQAEWNGWLGCVKGQAKPIGVAEYGLNCGQSGGNGAEPNALSTSEGMAADNSYLKGNPDGLPVAIWEYWWDTNGDPSGNCQFTAGGSPDGSQAAAQWQANETQNGGGAN